MEEFTDRQRPAAAFIDNLCPCLDYTPNLPAVSTNVFPHPLCRAFPKLAMIAGMNAALLILVIVAAEQASPPPDGKNEKMEAAQEVRAVWCHSPLGPYPGDWPRSMELLKRAGFNTIMPNMLWAGKAHYPSDILPRSYINAKYGDQIEQCLEAAKRHGIKVHVWKVNYNLEGAPKKFVEKLRGQGRLQLSADGKVRQWLCPSHPHNIALELKSMLEVARKYKVDGLHLDYIRYPGSAYCYCDGCRQRFEAYSGTKVADWPADCRRGSKSEAYNDWRCRQITRLVSLLHKEGKRIRPELKISAAVYGAYPDCRKSMAQDWGHWVEAGYLDFVCPMNYTENDPYFAALVKKQVKMTRGRMPCYPGIGATAYQAKLSPDRVLKQIEKSRALGADGFVLFEFNRRTAESHILQLGRGLQPVE
jgi:uncharacterized lipoprotein YddW (UPF0748 family)